MKIGNTLVTLRKIITRKSMSDPEEKNYKYQHGRKFVGGPRRSTAQQLGGAGESLVLAGIFRSFNLIYSGIFCSFNLVYSGIFSILISNIHVFKRLYSELFHTNSAANSGPSPSPSLNTTMTQPQAAAAAEVPPRVVVDLVNVPDEVPPPRVVVDLVETSEEEEEDEELPAPTGEEDEELPAPTGEEDEELPAPTGEEDEELPAPTGEEDEMDSENEVDSEKDSDKDSDNEVDSEMDSEEPDDKVDTPETPDTPDAPEKAEDGSGTKTGSDFDNSGSSEDDKDDKDNSGSSEDDANDAVEQPRPAPVPVAPRRRISMGGPRAIRKDRRFAAQLAARLAKAKLTRRRRP